jgi:hypothetical protein
MSAVSYWKCPFRTGEADSNSVVYALHKEENYADPHRHFCYGRPGRHRYRGHERDRQVDRQLQYTRATVQNRIRTVHQGTSENTSESVSPLIF